MIIRLWPKEFEMLTLIKKIIIMIFANMLPIVVFCLAVLASALITNPAQATSNCTDFLASSYFERTENGNRAFTGKLIILNDGTQ